MEHTKLRSHEKSYSKPVEILLVEDNPDDINLFVAALQESDMPNNLVIKTDGLAAINYLEQSAEDSGYVEPDMILLDLKLPKLDGFQVLERIKSNEAIQDVPVLVLSASDTEEDVQKAYRLNANCYLVKPMDFRRFVEMVRNVQQFWYQVARLPRRTD